MLKSKNHGVFGYQKTWADVSECPWIPKMRAGFADSRWKASSRVILPFFTAVKSVGMARATASALESFPETKSQSNARQLIISHSPKSIVSIEANCLKISPQMGDEAPRSWTGTYTRGQFYPKAESTTSQTDAVIEIPLAFA
jgi:hypothetical protein